MTTDELKAELTQINTAISDILTTGQSYSKPGFSRSAASLSELRELRDSLLRKISRADGGIASVSQVGPNSTSNDQFFVSDETTS